jgi:hypothetical protein
VISLGLARAVLVAILAWVEGVGVVVTSVSW